MSFLQGGRMKQIQLPSGMHDTLMEDCLKKQELKDRIEAVYASYGYRPIDTPLIEFYSTYASVFPSLKEEELYKFVDQDGMLLALRTDMTLPIARVCATKYANSEPPFRFRYCSSVYKVRKSFAGKRNEVTDCGIELIGLDEKSDLEVLSCALDVMAALPAENCTLEIGNSDFFKLAVREAGIGSEDAAVLADLIDRKAMTDAMEKLDALHLNREAYDFFRRLPLLNGRDALKDAARFAFAGSLQKETERFLKLEKDLEDLGYGGRFAFDLGKVPHLDYYTGIIFEGFVPGIGTAVLSGGRYDELLKKVGRDMPAIGFGVKVDYLLDAVGGDRPSVRKLVYPAKMTKEALLYARELRREGPVELVPDEAAEQMEVRG
jgi:ATP phosphoribosyltransferase regulatory subunit